MQRWEERRMLERLKADNKKASVLSCKRTNISHSCLQRGGVWLHPHKTVVLGRACVFSGFFMTAALLGFPVGRGREVSCVSRGSRFLPLPGQWET